MPRLKPATQLADLTRGELLEYLRQHVFLPRVDPRDLNSIRWRLAVERAGREFDAALEEVQAASRALALAPADIGPCYHAWQAAEARFARAQRADEQIRDFFHRHVCPPEDGPSS